MRKSLRRGCLLAALVFLGLFAWRQSQGWRGEQRLYQRLERQELQALLAAEVERSRPAVEALEAELEVADKSQQEEAGAIAPVRRELRRLAKKIRSAEGREQRSITDLRRALEQEGEGKELGGAASGELRAEVRQARIERESWQELHQEQEKRLAVLTADVREIEEKLLAERKVVQEIETRLRGVGPTGVWRHLPRGLDSSLRRREIRPAGFDQDIPWEVSPGVGALPQAGEARIDRCTTCHLVADRPDQTGTGWPEPLRGHPRPDLFLGEDSPHPQGSFGCTICHGGEGRATGFKAAGHGDRILTGSAVVPACLECHKDRAPLAGGASLRMGQTLIDRMGCEGCHQIGHSLAPSVRTGPPLGALASKTTQEWVAAWLASPRSYRRTTWMPHFFPLDAADETAVRRQKAEIRGIVAYLWRGVARDHREAPVGDPKAGERLFSEVGCTGCHLRDAEASRQSEQRLLDRLRGPNLARLDAKVQRGWLHRWLLAPRSYNAETLMPNLRLNAKEAADITDFLLATSDWSAPPLPAVDPEIRDVLVLEVLEEEESIEASEARLGAMDGVEREALIGRAAIDRLGCHGCHAIPGFEQQRPVGPDLRAIASRLEGMADRWQSREAGKRAWLRRGLAHPGGGDYGLGEEESAALVNVLSGLRTPRVAADRQATYGADKAGLVVGSALVERYGCRACHRLEGEGPALPSAVGAAQPPILDAVGARLRADWIFDFLGAPEKAKVRPWLSTRMPTFDFAAGERNAFASYFAQAAGRPLLASEPPAAGKDSLLLGKVVYRLLQCGRCHGEEGGAPSYGLADQRLRHTWVVQWILDPARHGPDSAMPTFFSPGEGGYDSTFLVDMIGTPIFADLRLQLRRGLGSSEEVRARLSQPEGVAHALRAYLWSLEP